MNKMTKDQSTRKAATGLPTGYRMRPITMDDLDATVALCNAWSQAAIGTDELSRGEIENFWGTPGLAMGEDLRGVFTPLGTMVGYVEAIALSQPPARPYVWHRVHPEYEGLGIGRTMLAWAEKRLARVLDVVDPRYRVAIGAQNVSGYAPTASQLEGDGYRVIRHSFQMRIEMESKQEAPSWPDGITLRPFDPDRDAEAVFRADDEAFSDHFGYIKQPFEQAFARFKHLMMEDEEAFDPSLWFIAMDGDDIAGICLCLKTFSEDPEMGWVEELGVRRPWRHRGLGLALLRHAFAEYYQRGFRKVGLWVDASSLTGAVRLYERAGMQVARQYDRYEKVLREGEELATVELGD